MTIIARRQWSSVLGILHRPFTICTSDALTTWHNLCYLRLPLGFIALINSSKAFRNNSYVALLLHIVIKVFLFSFELGTSFRAVQTPCLPPCDTSTIIPLWAIGDSERFKKVGQKILCPTTATFWPVTGGRNWEEIYLWFITRTSILCSITFQ